MTAETMTRIEMAREEAPAHSYVPQRLLEILMQSPVVGLIRVEDFPEQPEGP